MGRTLGAGLLAEKPAINRNDEAEASLVRDDMINRRQLEPLRQHLREKDRLPRHIAAGMLEALGKALGDKIARRWRPSSSRAAIFLHFRRLDPIDRSVRSLLNGPTTTRLDLDPAARRHNRRVITPQTAEVDVLRS